MTSSDTPSEAEKSSDEPRAAAGATEEISAAAPGDSVDAATSAQHAAPPDRARGGRGLAGPVRWLVRAVLAASCLASVLVMVMGAPFAPGGDSSGGEGNVTVVTLIEANTYGEAVAYVGPQQQGAELTGDDAIREAVSAALGRGNSHEVLIRASGGVSQREVERVRRLVSEAAPDGNQVAMSLALLTRE